MGNWAEHGTSWYNCNRYEEKSGTEARDAQSKSRASLERYLHVSASLLSSFLLVPFVDFLPQYYNRWANHELSAKLDRELYAKTEKKVRLRRRSSTFTLADLPRLIPQDGGDAVDVEPHLDRGSIC